MSARHFLAAAAGSLIALLFSGTASAQSKPSTLTIHAVDPSGAAIRGARVDVSTRDGRLTMTRETDGAGEARFHELLTGAHVIEIEATGFARAVRAIVLPRGATRVTIVLELGALAEQVFVTSADHPQTTAEVSKAVTVVDAGEIAARNEFSVGDALRAVPGLTVQQLGGMGAFTSLKIRGLREQDTSILIDGVRFRDSASPQGDGTAFVGELHVTNLDRIEVLRGSGSSLYGSHATGGVVNLITATGSGRLRVDLSTEAGGLGFSRVTAHTRGGVFGNRMTFSVGGGHTRVRRGIDGDDEAMNASVQGRGDVRLGTSARATLRVYASDADSSLNESPAAIGPLPAAGFVKAVPDTFIPAANDPDSTRASDFVSTLLRLECRPSPGFGYTISLHRLATERVFGDGPLGASAFEPPMPTSSRFAGTIDTFAVRADRDWSPRQTTRMSYEFERERYLSNALPVNRTLAWSADLLQDSHAVSVNHEVRLDPLQVMGSLRGQRFAIEHVSLSPAGVAPFTATSFASPPAALTADVAAVRVIRRTSTKLRVHAGNAFRSPAIFERLGVSFGSRGYSVYGDPGLEPERSTSVDAGVEQTMARGRALISATWFHTRLTRVIAFQSLDRSADLFGRASGYRSADGRTARGVELGARVQPHRATQINAAYTFVDAPPPDGSRDQLPRAAAVSAHQFSTFVTQQAGAFHVSFELQAAADHYVTLFDPVSFGSAAYRFAGFATADLSAGYRRPLGRTTARLFGTVENLFDRHYVVQGFRTPGRVVRGGVAATW